MWDGALGAVDADARSRAVLGQLLTMLRRDLERRPPDHTRRATTTRVPPWGFFRFEAGRMTWFLGALLALGGVTHLLLFAPRADYQASGATMALLAFGAIPFLGGLGGRSGPREQGIGTVHAPPPLWP